MIKFITLHKFPYLLGLLASETYPFSSRLFFNNIQYEILHISSWMGWLDCFFFFFGLCFRSTGCYFHGQPLDLSPFNSEMMLNASDITAPYYSLGPILTDCCLQARHGIQQTHQEATGIRVIITSCYILKERNQTIKNMMHIVF